MVAIGELATGCGKVTSQWWIGISKSLSPPGQAAVELTIDPRPLHYWGKLPFSLFFRLPVGP
jgi:hypothetical protein